MEVHQFSQNAKGTPPLTAIIIGAGFGGIGMAVALKKAGVDAFVILEKAQDVGGVWRENTYPGAACDVPSHLYSFSFAPNPNWSSVFSGQTEILEYLRDCAQKFELVPHILFGAEVEEAVFDEQASQWRVVLKDGSTLPCTMLISATGQLSRPVYPDIPGASEFKGRSFHSSKWDRRHSLDNERVAVIGTGASAIQFVPAIAGSVQKLTVFQRSPAYIMPRSDRRYSKWERALFQRVPAVTKLYRLGTYLLYESRAVGFTRLKELMKPLVGIPFRRMLARQVPDPALRAKLAPSYPIGCKRILLSSDYLATISRPNVELITGPVSRITAGGIETADGTHHQVDTIIYGTGFAASEFLSPMRIAGRNGVHLNDAWRDGAHAYLGITVPGFPNFFMLYGPNTNLGHSSIVYMLESQIAHVMRCYRALLGARATSIEVDSAAHGRYNASIQRRLAHTVWNGCTSWYLNESGRNTVNWPGFTLSYRWLTKYSGLQPYCLTNASSVCAPADVTERIMAQFLKAFLRVCFRPFIGPPSSPHVQRALVSLLSPSMPGDRGAARPEVIANGVRTQIVSPKNAFTCGAILYLHGGAFCLGGPGSHRSITTRLAIEAQMSVWVPDYRLAPEHPYPAALDDALGCYEAMLESGHQPEDIVFAGDSAGATLALELALRLRDRGSKLPAGLLLMSPLVDFSLSGSSIQANAKVDPMVREGWLRQGLGWYARPDSAPQLLQANLKGLPPMLVQVGEEEILLSDSIRLAERAANCKLEVYAKRWHVFHLQSFYLRSARMALRRGAEFARMQVAAAKTTKSTECAREAS